jgi:hypothetical protein
VLLYITLRYIANEWLRSRDGSDLLQKSLVLRDGYSSFERGLCAVSTGVYNLSGDVCVVLVSNVYNVLVSEHDNCADTRTKTRH